MTPTTHEAEIVSRYVSIRTPDEVRADLPLKEGTPEELSHWLQNAKGEARRSALALMYSRLHSQAI